MTQDVLVALGFVVTYWLGVGFGFWMGRQP